MTLTKPMADFGWAFGEVIFLPKHKTWMTAANTANMSATLWSTSLYVGKVTILADTMVVDEIGMFRRW